jgi:hypothetical protein
VLLQIGMSKLAKGANQGVKVQNDGTPNLQTRLGDGLMRVQNWPKMHVLELPP